MEKLQQWKKVKEMVESALDRERGERRAFLDEVCSKDSELRAGEFAFGRSCRFRRYYRRAIVRRCFNI